MSGGYELRLAEPSDSAWLARAALDAGGGLYEHLLVDALGDAAAEAALAAALADGEAALSWRNAIVATGSNGDAVGAAIAYPAARFGLAKTIRAAASTTALADLAALFATVPPERSHYLHAIWSAPEVRGAGVGGLLLDAVVAVGNDLGAESVSLHVWADNGAALKLYRSRGFRVVEKIDIPGRRRMRHDGGKFLMAAAI